MVKKIVILPILAFILFSCKQSREKMIACKWQASQLENPAFDEQVKQLNAFLDTVGKNTTPEQNLQLYGVQNLDSMKQVQQSQIAYALQQQKETVTRTFLDFHNDGKVLFSFGESPDTACWYFDKQNNLILDEKKLKGVGNIVKMELVKLDKNELQLRFQENGFNSTATFKPASN